MPSACHCSPVLNRCCTGLVLFASALLAPGAVPDPRPLALAPPPSAFSLPPLPPKAGHLIGRAMTEDARPVPEFTVAYHGFEDGKRAGSTNSGHLIETVNEKLTAKNGRYEVKLPPGAYRGSAYVSYLYHGRTYHFELAPLNAPTTHDFPGLQLDKLGQGLVRDFVLRMTGKRSGASEDSESVYLRAYYGGRVEFDVNQYTGILGGGNKLTPALGEMHPPESRVEVTLEPQGPRVDGSTGSTVVANVALGDSSRWTFGQRGIFPGVYTASARIIRPDGQTVPVGISLTPARTILGGVNGYDQVVVDWQKSVVVDFLPNDLKPAPQFGVKPVRLYLGP